MRQLSLFLAEVLALLAIGVLCAAVLTSELRRHRRRVIERVLSDADGSARPRAARVRRALVLELADRLTATSLTDRIPWLEEVTDAARRDLTRRPWLRRAKALRTLQPLGLSDAEVSAGLGDRHSGVRALAATLATGRTSQEVLARLVLLLHDPTPAVRNAALDALTRRAAHSTPALRAALAATPVLTVDQLSHEDELSRQADELARAVVLAGPSPVEAEGNADLVAPTQVVGSGVVAVGLPAEAAPGRVSTLPRPLRATTNIAIQTRTLVLLMRAVGSSAESELVEPVRPFLTDARPEIRAAAVATLAVLGEEPRLLLAALEDQDGRVRAEGVKALGRLGARAQSGVVARHLSDRDHGVRMAAAAALTQMEAPGTLLLRHALTGSDPFAADAARLALGLPPETP